MTSGAMILRSDPAPSMEADRAPSLRRNVIGATAALVLAFGGFLIWGFTAHLDSAAVASGTVIAGTKVKTVSHLEGGILKELLVKEGDHVVAGQPLLRLEDTRAQSELRQLTARRVGLVARLARLRAEQAGAEAVAFPTELTAATDTFTQEVIANETLLFNRRRDTLKQTIDAQRRQIDSLAADSVSADAQLAAVNDQTALVTEQLEAIKTLFDQGLATRAQLAAVETRVSELNGQASVLVGAKARAEEGRAQAEVEILTTETAWQSEVADALQSTQIDLGAIDDAIANAADVLRRVVVTAPEDGVVTNLQFRTTGGVIGAGQAILDVVPAGDDRIIEARLDPRDIDAVQIGAKVQIRLSAYGSRQSPLIEGTLSYVSADQVVDPRTSVSFYVVRTTVDRDPGNPNPVVLNAGEPVELLILNRPRVAIDYLLAPFTDSLRRAFREE